MLKSKTKIAYLAALLVTVLMNFQRVIMVLIDAGGFASSIGITAEALLLRMFLLFIYAYSLLSFNINWKNRWTKHPLHPKAFRTMVNAILFILGVLMISSVMAVSLDGALKYGQVLLIILTDFLVVQPILLLIARFVNLSFKQQQIVLEREQAKQSALQHQLEALRAQINPHFLFNTLNSLTVLIRSKSNRALAFVEQLSWLLRATLLRSEEHFISLQNELEYLESYVFLQKERFGEKFKVDIQVPENWKKKLIPSFSLQLLAENAIKHNIVSKKQPLLLEIYPNGAYLVIRNPIRKRRDKTEGTGLGLFHLSARFKLLKAKNIEINQNENYFTVKLPILEDEGSNH